MVGPLGDVLPPELVTPLVVYLVSPQATTTHEIFSVGGGRVARVFIGLTQGWFQGKGNAISPEDIAAHLDEIRATDDFIIPNSVADEMMLLMTNLNG